MTMHRRSLLATATTTGVVSLMPLRAFAENAGATPADDDIASTGYAPVNGLEMYYEIHGSGEPLLLLHGAFGAIPMWSAILAQLANERQVIAIEFQGHGRTADTDRPFSYELFSDDVAAVMDHLDIDQADILGYSMGGNTALQLAIRHPDRVRKLVLLSANYRYDGEYSDVLAGLQGLTPDMLAGTPIEEMYRSMAPDPDHFSAFVEKLQAFLTTDFAFPEEDIQGIASPAFLAYGDSDTVQLDHAVALFHLLGGGVPGDFYGLPDDQLMILPGITHETILAEQTDRLVERIGAFLSLPEPEAA